VIGAFQRRIVMVPGAGPFFDILFFIINGLKKKKALLKLFYNF